MSTPGIVSQFDSPAAPCCDCVCGWTLCVRGCNDEEIREYNYQFTKSGGAEGSSGGYTAENPAPECGSEFVVGGLTTGSWTVTITPVGDWADFFQPTTIGFEVTCPSVVHLEVILDPIDDWACGECQPCPGLPFPDNPCYELVDPYGNVITLTPDLWVGGVAVHSGCRAYTPLDEVAKYCPSGDFGADCNGEQAVPIVFTVTGCNPLVVGISYPVGTWFYAGGCEVDGYVPPIGCDPPPFGCAQPNFFRAGSPIYCDDYYVLVGGQTCLAALNTFRGISPVNPCPTDPDGGIVNPVTHTWHSISFEVDLDCPDPSGSVEVELPTGEECVCCIDGATTVFGTNSGYHPLQRIFGTAAGTWTARFC